MEARAARACVGARAEVVEAGIALSTRSRFDGIAISCGVAGGLRDDLPTGTVLVPDAVARPDGSMRECDARITQALREAAQRLGFAPERGPIVTTSTLVHGRERAAWAAKGYAGVDMETGLIVADQVACVRVILDTPLREISPAWQTPTMALFAPRAWLDLPFLAREGPRCASIAARVVAAALDAID